jgi:hypothetical protein
MPAFQYISELRPHPLSWDFSNFVNLEEMVLGIKAMT